MKFASMLNRLRNTQGGGTRSSAGSGYIPYAPYTAPTPLEVDAGSDQIVSQGDTVKFSGSVVTAPNGVTLTYKWTFDDETNPAASSTGLTASYTYPTHGNKTVRLTASYTGTGGKKVEASDTLKVKVISIDPKTVNDGESPVFSVLGATDATAFSWGWRLPSDLGLNPVVGNNPGVVFLPPKSTEPPNTTTIDRAKWYAHPNRACGPKNLVASRSSKYTITCDITFPNGRSFTATSTLTVKVPWTDAGAVRPVVRIITYQTETVRENNIEVLKIKEGTLKATRELREEFNIPKSSYFYNKMRKHEDKHVEQFNPGGVAADLFNVPDALWDYPYPTQKEISLKDARGTTLGLLELSIRIRTANFRSEEDKRFTARIPAMEREAYSVSDPLVPQYIFQNCGRY